MDTRFLLLRNNKATGPYTIDELLQQHLQPADLVWLEGYSSAWAAPMEFGELRPYLAKKRFSDIAARNRHKSAAMELEKKAAALKQQVLSYKASHPYSWPKQTEIEHTGTPDGQQPEIEFIDHRIRPNAFFEIFSAALVTMFVAACVYGGYVFVAANSKTLPVSSSFQTVSVDENAAKKPFPTTTQTQASFPEPATDTATFNKTRPVAAAPSAQPRQPLVPVIAKPQIVRDTVVKKPALVTAADSVTKPTDTTASKSNVPPVKATPTQAVADTMQQQPAAEKKKTLGQVLKGLFKKKKKHQADSSSETAREKES